MGRPEYIKPIEDALAIEGGPTVILMVGVPGSGKSTVGNNLAEALDISIHSSDKCRAELGEGEEDQSVSQQAWALVHERATEDIEAGRSTIIDGTNTTENGRRAIVEQYKKLGARVVALVVSVDIETAHKRNQSRNRKVPEFVINSMHKQLSSKTPGIDERFDQVIIYDNSAKT